MKFVSNIIVAVLLLVTVITSRGAGAINYIPLGGGNGSINNANGTNTTFAGINLYPNPSNPFMSIFSGTNIYVWSTDTLFHYGHLYNSGQFTNEGEAYFLGDHVTVSGSLNAANVNATTLSVNGVNVGQALSSLNGASAKYGWAIDDFNTYSVGVVSLLTNGYGFREPGIVTGGDARIVSDTYLDGETRNVLRMRGGDYVRKLPWGTNWTDLRIAVWLSVSNTSTFTNVWALGVCVGTNAPYGSAATDLFLGMDINPANGMQFNASNSFSPPFYNAAFQLRQFTMKTNNVRNDNGSGSGSTATGVGMFPHTSAKILQLTKPLSSWDNVGNTNIGWRMRGPSHLNTDISPVTVRPNLAGIMDDTETLNQNFNGNSVMAGANSASPVAVNAGLKITGLLDTINIHWFSTSVHIDILAIAVYKAR